MSVFVNPSHDLQTFDSVCVDPSHDSTVTYYY